MEFFNAVIGKPLRNCRDFSGAEGVDCVTPQRRRGYMTALRFGTGAVGFREKGLFCGARLVVLSKSQRLNAAVEN